MRLLHSKNMEGYKIKMDDSIYYALIDTKLGKLAVMSDICKDSMAGRRIIMEIKNENVEILDKINVKGVTWELNTEWGRPENEVRYYFGDEDTEYKVFI